jgi:muramoyltetrapeptide carboxypeptidase LdcA involved in peptidoglycan recycling
MFPGFENIILFWETIDLEQNKINTILHSLKISGLFKKVKGIVI